MSGFSLKTEHFTTPIRLVLPGIVVSVLGLFVSNYVFNNPNKIRGNSSRKAWDYLKQYENIYRDYTENLACEYKGTIREDYSRHLIHLQEMTAENLKMLRDDKDVDKLMAAIINLRIDTYTQLKNSSRGFFDTLFAMNNLADSNRGPAEQANMQIKFLKYNEHVYKRDSSIINLLGQELNKHYKTFKNVNFNIFNNPADTLLPAELQSNIIGTWSLLTNDDIPISLKIDTGQSGTWTQPEIQLPLTWKLERTKLTIRLNNDTDIVFDAIDCSENTISFHCKINNIEWFVVACKVKDK